MAYGSGRRKNGEKQGRRYRGYTRNQYQVLTMKKDRLTALDLLGGKCVRCGISDERVLEIDHVNRTENGMLVDRVRKGTNAVVLRIKKAAKYGKSLSDWQVLCANCHRIKTRENRDHGHLGEKDSAKPELTLFRLFSEGTVQ